MTSPNGFVVEPLNGKRYDFESKTIEGFILSSNQEDATYTNRFAKVLSVPEDDETGIKIGDTVIVHHNVFRVTSNMKGIDKKSSFWMFDDMYFIDDSLIFAIAEGDEIKPLKGYNFVKPVLRYTNSYQNNTGVYEEQAGIIEYPDEDAYKKGDFIYFKKDSEYRFNIGEGFLYRVKTQNIWAKRHQHS